jgi:hypothetical protein
MRFISGAIVVFSGCVLWAAGSIGASLSIIEKAEHHTPAEFATWGGFGVMIAGLLIIGLTLLSPQSGRDSG